MIALFMHVSRRLFGLRTERAFLLIIDTPFHRVSILKYGIMVILVQVK